jgi:hypothetical protein
MSSLLQIEADHELINLIKKKTLMNSRRVLLIGNTLLRSLLRRILECLLLHDGSEIGLEGDGDYALPMGTR